MNVFEKLKAIALEQNECGDFPAWFMKDIFAITDAPERYTDKINLVELLITQIGNYDAYAGSGCFDVSVSAETIAATIRQIITQ